MTKQLCPLCGSRLYCVDCLGKKEKCEHKFDHAENIKCVKNGFRFFQDELDDYTKQLFHIRQQAKQEVFKDIDNFIDFDNWPRDYAYYARENKKLFNDIKKKHGVE